MTQEAVWVASPFTELGRFMELTISAAVVNAIWRGRGSFPLSQFADGVLFQLRHEPDALRTLGPQPPFLAYRDRGSRAYRF